MRKNTTIIEYLYNNFVVYRVKLDSDRRLLDVWLGNNINIGVCDKYKNELVYEEYSKQFFVSPLFLDMWGAIKAYDQSYKVGNIPKVINNTIDIFDFIVEHSKTEIPIKFVFLLITNYIQHAIDIRSVNSIETLYSACEVLVKNRFKLSKYLDKQSSFLIGFVFNVLSMDRKHFDYGHIIYPYYIISSTTCMASIYFSDITTVDVYLDRMIYETSRHGFYYTFRLLLKIQHIVRIYRLTQSVMPIDSFIRSKLDYISFDEISINSHQASRIAHISSALGHTPILRVCFEKRRLYNNKELYKSAMIGVLIPRPPSTAYTRRSTATFLKDEIGIDKEIENISTALHKFEETQSVPLEVISVQSVLLDKKLEEEQLKGEYLYSKMKKGYDYDMILLNYSFIGAIKYCSKWSIYYLIITNNLLHFLKDDTFNSIVYTKKEEIIVDFLQYLIEDCSILFGPIAIENIFAVLIDNDLISPARYLINLTTYIPHIDFEIFISKINNTEMFIFLHENSQIVDYDTVVSKRCNICELKNIICPLAILHDKKYKLPNLIKSYSCKCYNVQENNISKITLPYI